MRHPHGWGRGELRRPQHVPKLQRWRSGRVRVGDRGGPSLCGPRGIEETGLLPAAIRTPTRRPRRPAAQPPCCARAGAARGWRAAAPGNRSPTPETASRACAPRRAPAGLPAGSRRATPSRTRRTRRATPGRAQLKKTGALHPQRRSSCSSPEPWRIRATAQPRAAQSRAPRRRASPSGAGMRSRPAGRTRARALAGRGSAARASRGLRLRAAPG